MFVCQIKEECLQDNSNEANSNRLLVVIFSTAAVVFVDDVDENCCQFQENQIYDN